VSAQMDRLGNLLPPAELRRLTCGSHEQHLQRVFEALKEHFQGQDFAVVATRREDVVVMLGESCYHLWMSEGSSGRLEFREARPIQVETLKATATRDHWLQEAREIASLLISGASGLAEAHLRELVLKARPQLCESAVIEEIACRLQAPAAWKQVLAAQGARETLLAESIQAPGEDRLRLTFRALYDGLVDGDPESYSDQVNEELDWVIGQSERLLEETKAHQTSVRGVVLQEQDHEPTLVLFENFATDLIKDLRATHEDGLRAALYIGDVRSRARLHDVLADGLRERSAASRFVAVVADRLIS
jgi:hypothetical protein